MIVFMNFGNGFLLTKSNQTGKVDTLKEIIFLNIISFSVRPRKRKQSVNLSKFGTGSIDLYYITPVSLL